MSTFGRRPADGPKVSTGTAKATTKKADRRPFTRLKRTESNKRDIRLKSWMVDILSARRMHVCSSINNLSNKKNSKPQPHSIGISLGAVAGQILKRKKGLWRDFKF